MNGGPTSEQRLFHEWCRQYGCILTGDEYPEIHHIAGAKMNLKGCHKPGEWYVIPLSYHWHRNPKNKYSLAAENGKRPFTRYWMMTEKDIWEKLIKEYELQYGFKPMEDHIYNAIVERG